MALPILTREQLRQVDQLAIHKYGIPGVVLMENAGRGIVEVMLADGVCGPVVIACGKGNNAGDGFVMARQLAVQGVPCEVLLFCPPTELHGDAAINFNSLRLLELPWRDLSQVTQAADIASHLHAADWLVDALLGTGGRGNPSGPLAAAIRALNQAAGRRLAVDIPSGLDCDTGLLGEPTFQADITCTMVAAKPGFLNPAAANYVGEIRIIDIGVPARIIAEAARPRS